MILLSRRSLLAIAAVVDIALHARPSPVAAKHLAARHNLPPRHLETMLQALVRAGILKGVRGPRGGYEIARERRRASRRATSSARPWPRLARTRCLRSRNPRWSTWWSDPMVAKAGAAFLSELDAVTVDDLCRQAEARRRVRARTVAADFTI